MAAVTREKINAFLSIGSGYGYGCGYGCGDGSGDGDGYGCGYGSGDGDGYGSGSGSGCGSGYGDGYGSGDGDGYGSGYGCGDGIPVFDGNTVVKIDGCNTLLYAIHGNVAKGAILNSDLSLEPCFVCKQNNFFAHGRTIQEAMCALNDKLFEDMPEEERINAFASEFELDKVYPNKLFFDWHNRLTGSCEQGRRAFAKGKDIDIESGQMTTREFVLLTKDAWYGASVMRNVAKAYGLEE